MHTIIAWFLIHTYASDVKAMVNPDESKDEKVEEPPSLSQLQVHSFLQDFDTDESGSMNLKEFQSMYETVSKFPDASHQSLLEFWRPVSAAPTPLGGTNDANAQNLEACIGECDNDGQCRSGLKCFQRTGYTPVPGCGGEGTKDWDYCYDPSGSTELQGGNDAEAKNLEACIGECDSDGQCKAGLTCFQRSHGETIPGCTGLGGGKNWDYCYDPSWTPTLSFSEARNGDVGSISGSESDVKAVPLDVVSFSTGLSLFGVSALVWASQ